MSAISNEKPVPKIENVLNGSLHVVNGKGNFVNATKTQKTTILWKTLLAAKKRVIMNESKERQL